jgi:pterin-4a-carbinolamine dehydratase
MSPWPAPERDLWRPRAGVLSAAELRRALGDHPGWRLDGERLVRELRFRDFRDAFGLVERLAGEVEDFGRQPDICLVDGNRVRVAVANPNRAGLTVTELRLVGKVDGVVDDHMSDVRRVEAAGAVPADAHERPLEA